jgi:hypothetical protein
MAWPRELRPDSWQPSTPLALAASPRVSRLATSGFVLALLVPPVGFFVSAAGWLFARRSVGFVTGEGLAAAGVLVAAVEVALYLVIS